MKGGRFAVCWWLVALGLLLSSALESGAAEVYRQTPTPGDSGAARQEAGPDEARVSFEEVRRGMISFDLRRDAGSTSPRSGAVPVKFLDQTGETVLVLRIACSFDEDPGRAALMLHGPEFRWKGLGLWDPLILLDREIEPGATVHFDLAWDDERKQVGLFVDGQGIDPRPGTYDAARKTFGPGVRELANERNARLGEPPTYASLPFGYFLAKVRTIVVGDTPRAGGLRGNPGKNGLVGDTRVDNLSITVDEAPADVRSANRNVRKLTGSWSNGGVVLTWEPPEPQGINQRYAVYRRSGGEDRGRFEKLTTEPLRGLLLLDATAEAGQTYRYTVSALQSDGTGNDLESKHPPEITVTTAGLFVGAWLRRRRATVRARRSW